MSWRNEPVRHGLASRGISTKFKANAVTEGESFQFYRNVYDVWEANEIIRENPREPYKISVDEWMSIIDKEGENSIAGVSVDWDYARTLTEEDCKREGIAVLTKDGAQLIDGHHRLVACHLHNIDEFPVYVLESEEAWEICNHYGRQNLKPPENGWDDKKKRILKKEVVG